MIILKLEVENHPEDSISGQLMKDTPLNKNIPIITRVIAALKNAKAILKCKKYNELRFTSPLIPDKLFGNASAVAWDVRVGVELPRVLTVAGDP